MINRFLDMEPFLSLREDKLEFLEAANIYLSNSKVDINIVKNLAPIISKYLVPPIKKNNIPKRNEDKPSLQLFFPPSIRSEATSCQFKITYHNPTSENKTISSGLFNDDEEEVRIEACANLSYIDFVDHSLGLSIANKVLEDTWKVRWNLQNYLNYLGRRNRRDAIKLCDQILDKFGTTKNGKLEEDALLRHAINVIVVLYFEYKDRFSLKLFNRLLFDDSLNSQVKNTLAFECAHEKILSNRNNIKKVLKVFINLINSKIPQVKYHAISSLLYNLTKLGISYFPTIKPILEKISKIKCKSDVIGGQDDCVLLHYLAKFCQEAPQESAEYLINMYRLMPNPTNYQMRANQMFTIIATLKQSGKVKSKTKEKLIEIGKDFYNIVFFRKHYEILEQIVK